jgi:hypothetical protein
VDVEVDVLVDVEVDVLVDVEVVSLSVVVVLLQTPQVNGHNVRTLAARSGYFAYSQ